MMKYEYSDGQGDQITVNGRAGWIKVNREVVEFPAAIAEEIARAVVGDDYRVVPTDTDGVDDQPPNHLLLDLWSALGGDPARFDEWNTEHGKANTWGQLLQIVRQVFRPVCGKPVDGEFCVLTAPRSEADMHVCHGKSDVGIDDLPPIPAAQPHRPEPVDPASVRVGDIVEIEADDWMVRGKVDAVYATWSLCILPGPDWISIPADATVRILHREPVPDEAAVEALARALHATANVGIDWDKLTDPSGWYERARSLIRDHGVSVEVPTDA